MSALDRGAAERRIEALLVGRTVRVIWSTEDEIADVLVGADSASDRLWAVLRAVLADLPWAPWEVDPSDDAGDAAVAAVRGARPGALASALGGMPSALAGPVMVTTTAGRVVSVESKGGAS